MGQYLILLVILHLSCTIVTAQSPCARYGDGTADVIIVGGGIAGLTAALKLATARSFCIIVLEADSALGGRCKNWDVGEIKGYTTSVQSIQVAIGGSFFNPALEPTFAWLVDEAGLSESLFPSSYLPRWIMNPFYSPPALVSSNFEDYEIMSFAIILGRRFPVLTLAPVSIQNLQQISVEEWLSKAFPRATSNAKQMIREFVLLQMSIPADEQPAYGFIQYAADIVPFNENKATINEAFPEGPGGALIYQVVGGTGKVIVNIEKKLRALGVIFRTGRKVTKLDQSDSMSLAVETTYQSTVESYRAIYHLIVTAGPSQINQIQFNPPLDQDVRWTLQSEKPHTTVDLQVFVFFKTKWWFKLSFTQFPKAPVIVPSEMQFRQMRENPPKDAPRIFGTTVLVPPVDTSNETLLHIGIMRIMVPGDLYKSSENSLVDDVISYMLYFGVRIPDGELLDVKTYNWSRYTTTVSHGYFPTDVLIHRKNSMYLQANGGQDGRILFAGTETSIGFVNTLEGAARSGYFAGNKVLEQIHCE